MTPAGLERRVETHPQQTRPEHTHPERSSPPEGSLVERIQINAVARPSAAAIRFGDTVLSYRELDWQSDRLARRLRALGIVGNVLVGLLVERSPAMVVALLAILKAGAAYLPLDSTYPALRLQTMLDEAQVALLISSGDLLASLGLTPPKNLLLLPMAEKEPLHTRTDEPAATWPPPHPEDTAYVIFTSGSTGRPKGVEITHSALLNLLWSLKDSPGIAATDTMLAVTSIAFDIATAEIFLPLLSGATIDLAGSAEAAHPAQLLEKIDSGTITILQATPVTWRLLILAGWQGAAPLTVWCGGEEMTESLARDLLARSPSVWNLYGPTETTIWSTRIRLERATRHIPLGDPIANTSLHILDEQQRQVAPGTPGELYLGGAGLARGYYRRPDLTLQSFPTIRLADGRTERLYRTGDRARLTHDGTLEFLGRLDRQVKLRGFRIELAEIEHAALQCPGVQQAALAKIEDPIHGDLLAAFAVPTHFEAGPAAVTAADLRRHLAQRLPAAMVPSSIRIVRSLPTTLNGKLDRRRLATLNLDPQASAHPSILDAFDEPRPGLETRLASLWCEALAIPSIGRDENFFAIGGDSLLGAHLETGMAAAIDPRCTVGSLLRSPTIAAYAAYLAGAALPVSVLLHPGSPERRSLDDTIFWMDNPDRLPRLAALLALPFYSMLLRPDDIAREAPRYALEALAQRMVEHILTLERSGGFIIGGFCQNALLAYEVACQLHAAGHPVPLMILIDPLQVSPGKVHPGKPSALAQALKGLRIRITRELFHLHSLARLSPSAWPAYLRQRYEGMRFEIEGKRWQRAARTGSPAPSPAPALAQALFASRISYVPRPYPAPVLFIEPTAQPRSGHDAKVEAWRSLAPQGTWRSVSGNHLGLFVPPAVEGLAKVIGQALKPSA